MHTQHTDHISPFHLPDGFLFFFFFPWDIICFPSIFGRTGLKNDCKEGDLGADIVPFQPCADLMKASVLINQAGFKMSLA